MYVVLYDLVNFLRSSFVNFAFWPRVLMIFYYSASSLILFSEFTYKIIKLQDVIVSDSQFDTLFAVEGLTAILKR